MITLQEAAFIREAITQAESAEHCGNLPIGAVVVLDGKVVSRGANAIWNPSLDPSRHAEIEALRGTPAYLWSRSREMSLYTTLEPCLMCAAAILLHNIGRIVFGSADPYGGASTSFKSLPPYFRDQLEQIQWIGPAARSECDPLYDRTMLLLKKQGIEPDRLFPDI